MRFPLLALAAAAILPTTAPAIAAPPAPEKVVTVVMAGRHFHPQVIRLTRGQHYRILLVNRDDTGHNFDSKGFFSHASIGPEGVGEQAVHEGLITVPAHDTVGFDVTPTSPGPYNLTSSVALDAVSGMQGQILVY